MDAGDLVPDDLIIAMILDRIGRGRRQRRLPARRLPAHDRAGRGARRGARPTRPPAHRGAARSTCPTTRSCARLSGRRVCVKNPEHIYHVDFDPPKHEGVCDQDGSRLIQRDDDKPENGQAAPGGLPRADRAADRLLRGARAAAPLRRHAGAGRGPRPHPRDARDAAARRASSVIIKKSPEEIEKMAAAGAILVRRSNLRRGQGPAGRHDGRARRGRRELHPLAGRRAGLQGLSRLPGLDLRLAELDDRARHPRALQAAKRRHHLHRRRA